MLEEESVNPELSKDFQDKAWVLLHMIKDGRPCPAVPKVKLKAIASIFGVFVFAITGYNVLRNICSIRVE
jgi:hypothetical protein